MPDPRPKQVVRRLIDEVMNHADLSVLDELYAPRLAAAARRWIEPFLASFSDVHMRIVELVAEGDTVVGRFTCSGTHTGTWLGHPATGRRFEDVAEVYFFRIVKGRIVQAWGLEDTRERLRQLGLSDTRGQAGDDQFHRRPLVGQTRARCGKLLTCPPECFALGPRLTCAPVGTSQLSLAAMPLEDRRYAYLLRT